MIKNSQPCIWQVDTTNSGIETIKKERFPVVPGEATFRQSQKIYHYAPGKWLCVSPDGETLAILNKISEDDFVNVTDISGYWTEFIMDIGTASQVLSATIPIDLILDNRSCSAVTLFDCPSILSRFNLQLAVLVMTSYSLSFSNVYAAIENIQK